MTAASLLVLIAFACLASEVEGVPGVSFATPLMNMVTYGPKVPTKDGDIVIQKLDPTVKPPAEVKDQKALEGIAQSKKLLEAQKDEQKTYIGSIWKAATTVASASAGAATSVAGAGVGAVGAGVGAVVDTTTYVADTVVTGAETVVNVADHAAKLLGQVLEGFPDLIVAALKAVGSKIMTGMEQTLHDTILPKSTTWLSTIINTARSLASLISFLQITGVSGVKIAVVLPQVQMSSPYSVGFLLTEFRTTINGKFNPPGTVGDGNYEYKFRSAGINVLGSIDVKTKKFFITKCEGAVYANFVFNKGEGVMGTAVNLVDKVNIIGAYAVNLIVRQAVCAATTYLVNLAFEKTADAAKNIREYAEDPMKWAESIAGTAEAAAKLIPKVAPKFPWK